MCLPEVVSAAVSVLMDLQPPVSAVPVFFKSTDRHTDGYSIDDDSALPTGGLNKIRSMASWKCFDSYTFNLPKGHLVICLGQVSVSCNFLIRANALSFENEQHPKKHA